MSRPLTPEDLYPFRSWVRSLAVRLASNEADALDLEQQVWATAVAKPPGEATNVRAWLATVARNAAHNLRRAATRRERHESLARPVPNPADPADLAAEAEAQRMLVGAVLELEQPYRDTVLLRWFEGLAPREVAERQGVPLATVYTRLARAHGLLRDRLDRTHGSRKAWVLLLVPAGAGLPDQPGAARPAADGPTVATATSGTTVGFTGGSLMLATLTKTLAAATVVGLLAFFAFWEGDGNPGQDDKAQSAEAAEEVRRRRATYNPVPQIPKRGEALQDTDPESDLAGIVVDPAGTPVAGAEVTVVDYPWTSAGVSNETAALLPRERGRTKSRTDGTFALQLRRGDSVNVQVSADGFATAEHVLRSAGERTRIELQRAVGLVLLCERQDGSAVAGVSVLALTWPPDSEPRVVRRGVSGEDGRIAWTDLPPGVKIHAHPTGWPEAMEVTLPAEGSVERTLPFGLGRPITGRVIAAASGDAVPGALVDLGPLGDSTTTAAADGTFRLDNWMGRDRGTIRCTAPGFTIAAVRPGDASEVTISLTRGVYIRGRLVSADGVALSGAHVAATGKDDADRSARRNSAARAISDEEGRFDLPDLSSEYAHRLIVSARGHARLDRILPASEEDTDLGDLVLGPSRTIAGRLVAGESGVPRVTIELILKETGDAGSAGRVAMRRTDHEGRFRFGDLAPGTYVVFSWGDGGPMSRRTVELPPDSDVLDLVIGDVPEDGARMLVVTVVDNRGEPVAGSMVLASATTPPNPPSWGTTAADGVARMEVPTRRLNVQARLPKGSKRAWAYPLRGSTALVDADATSLTLTLVEGVRTTGTVRRADGSVQPGALVNARTADGQWINTHADKKGGFRLTVPHGEPVTLRWAGQFMEPNHRVGHTDEYVELPDVTPGAAGVLVQGRVVLRDQELRVRVTLPDGEPSEGIEVWAHDLSGRNSTTAKATTDADGRATLSGLTARTHRIGTGRDTGMFGRAKTREVTPGEADEVVLKLRAMVEISGTVVDAHGQPFTHYDYKGKQNRVAPWAMSGRSGGQSWSATPVDSSGAFTIRVSADDPGPFWVELNLPPTGSGENWVQLGGKVKDVRPGDTAVRLVIAPLHKD